MAGLESPMDLYFAARDGDIARVKRLAKACSSLNFVLGFTLLQWTTIWDRFEVAECLVLNNCDINRKADDGRTAVLMAAENHRKNIVELLVKHGAHLDGCTGVYKWSLLHYACFYGWTQIAEIILGKGAVDVNVESSDMRTPLMLSIQNGNESITELLIGAGAEFRSCDAERKSVLHYASSTVCYSKEGLAKLVSRILERGDTDLNAESAHEWTPLLYALSTGKEDIAEILIRTGVVVDTGRLPTTGMSVLEHCIKMGWTKLVRMVFEKWGCDLHPSRGHIPLHLALFQSRNIETILLLIKSGADVNFENESNERALYYAIVRDDIELIRLLLKHGAYFGSRESKIILKGTQLDQQLLEDVQLLTLSEINKINYRNLAAVYNIPGCCEVLPQIETMTINNYKSTAAQEIESYVENYTQHIKIGKIYKGTCIVLKLLCVSRLCAYWETL